MKITEIYVYPIKALRGIALQQALVGPQGICFDRRFMLCKIQPDGSFRKMQLSSFPQCALFEQTLIPQSKGFIESSDESSEDESYYDSLLSTTVEVRYHPPHPQSESAPEEPPRKDDETLAVPLVLETSSLQKVTINLHDSPTDAYRMGDPYDAWFSSRFGFQVALIYLGDGRRAVLGKSLLPPGSTSAPGQANQRVSGWLSSLTSILPGNTSQPQEPTPQPQPPWITFTDCAPLLITSTSSLSPLLSQLPPQSPIPMYKFRPNLVVSSPSELPFAEDFWAELVVTPSLPARLPPTDPKYSSSSSSFYGDSPSEYQEWTDRRKRREEAKQEAREKSKWRMFLTGNCARCTSLNVDYETGRQAEGELGKVLKMLMKDRRVDKGNKWSPVFGRYAFMDGGRIGEHGWVVVKVGDEVEVGRRNEERTVWDWVGLE